MERDGCCGPSSPREYTLPGFRLPHRALRRQRGKQGAPPWCGASSKVTGVQQSQSLLRASGVEPGGPRGCVPSGGRGRGVRGCRPWGEGGQGALNHYHMGVQGQTSLTHGPYLATLPNSHRCSHTRPGLQLCVFLLALTRNLLYASLPLDGLFSPLECKLCAGRKDGCPVLCQHGGPRCCAQRAS